MAWKKCSVVQQREELVLAILARREPVRLICKRFKVSRPTAYKYVRRFLLQGKPGLKGLRRGRKPKHAQRWLVWHKLILRERQRRPSRGARKLRWWLRQQQPRRRLPSVRTIARWLRTAGLVPIRRLRRVSAPVPLQPPRRGRRSNEVWTFDWKGWNRTGNGTKVEPLTVRDLGSRFILWAYPLASRSDSAVRRVCRRLFRCYGVPKAIRTDLGGPFCSCGPHGFTTLSLWWYRLGISVEFVHRGIGLHNNAHEQMHGVLQRETANPPAQTRAGQLRRLRRWRYEYNHERPHDAIGGLTPARRYRPKPAHLPIPRTPKYHPRWPVRIVSHSGNICLWSQRHYIGRTFAGLPVGCKPFRAGYQIHFDRLLLAMITPRTSSPHSSKN